MRLLKINGITVDIDNDTVIAIDLQTYDIKEPAKRFINISNTFSIPLTAKNSSIFGNSQNVQSTSLQIYDFNYVEYWQDNEQLIENSKVKIDSIDSRINLIIFSKADIWDELKQMLWPDFITDYILWRQTSFSLPSISSPFAGTFTNFLTPYIQATSDIIMPAWFGNLAQHKSGGEKVSTAIGIQGSPELITPDTNYICAIQITCVKTGYIEYNFLINSSLAATNSDVAAFIFDSLPDSFTDEFDTDLVNAALFFKAKTSFYDPNFLFHVEYTNDEGKMIDVNSAVGATGLEPNEYYTERLFNPPINDTSGYLFMRLDTRDETNSGGRFGIFVKSIFQYIEQKFNVDFLTAGGQALGNIWDDSIANSMYVPARDIDITFINETNMYFHLRQSPFLPFTDQLDKPDKSLYDFVMSFMQHLNLLKDELIIGGQKVIRLSRFDDIKELAEVVDFSGKLSGKPTFKPYVESYTQNNRILFKEKYPDASELLNSRNITCLNKNIDYESELFSIDAYVNSLFIVNDDNFPNLSDQDSFKTFSFFVSEKYSTNKLAIFYKTPFTSRVFSANMQIPAMYDLNSEYNFLEEILQYPRFYEIEKWLSVSDIRNLEFFKQYWIRELNGSFFINKISGFNPDKSNEPTTLELIKISNKTPLTSINIDYYTDGIGDPWTDKDDDYYY